MFCNNPFDETVTRANLLDHIRNAKVHLSTTESIISDNTTTKVLAVSKPNSDTNSDIVTAIRDLSLQINNHINHYSNCFKIRGTRGIHFCDITSIETPGRSIPTHV